MEEKEGGRGGEKEGVGAGVRKEGGESSSVENTAPNVTEENSTNY